MKGKKGEGFGMMKIHCLDNKKDGEGIRGRTWTNFVNNTISPKVERFGIENPFSFIFPSLPF